MIHTNDDETESSEPAAAADKSRRTVNKNSNRANVSNIATTSWAQQFLFCFFSRLLLPEFCWMHHGRLGRMWCIAHIYSLYRFFVHQFHQLDRRISVTMPILATNDFITIAEMRPQKNANNDAKLYGKNIFRSPDKKKQQTKYYTSKTRSQPCAGHFFVSLIISFQCSAR